MPRTTTTQAKPRHRAGLRALALLVLLLSLVAQGSSFVHFFLIEHAVCPQHGELIHADEAGHHPLHASTAPDTGHTAAQPAAAEAAHAHDHCAVVSDRRERWACLASLGSVASPPEVEMLAAVRVRTSSCVPAVPLLLLAPKSSPPA